ncbi:TPA: hypothetical protein I8Y12_000875 [Raoultella planticola]|nr:hypothetical protein [Raoultella planticola]
MKGHLLTLLLARLQVADALIARQSMATGGMTLLEGAVAQPLNTAEMTRAKAIIC